MGSNVGPDTFGEEFFRRRVRYAWDYRKTVMPGDTGSCRVIFGESDMFPGLTVDKFSDILVVQSLCLGTELRLDWILPALAETIEADGVAIRGNTSILCAYPAIASSIELSTISHTK